MTDPLTAVDPETRAVLDAYGFDEDEFLRLWGRVRDGSLSPQSNVFRGRIEPPRPDDIVVLPEPGDATYDDARERGLAVLREGGVGSVVLNGGMATRFGGVVKGIVEAVDGQSFLELKLRQTREVADALGVDLPSVVMNSWATDAATRTFLAERSLPEPMMFSQRVSLRLDTDGGLFHGADGRPSLYSPGHGDFLQCVRTSGTLDALRARGVRHLMVSNVDNLPARIDPVVVGTHVREGRAMTAEVVQNTGNVGGAPARVDGRLLIVESMRFPAGFDHSQLPVTNVNTVTFDLDALDRDFDLTWLYVEKSVDGRTAVQLERLYHEASAFLDTTYLQVPDSGPRMRFLPIKKPEDLSQAQPALREMLATPV